MKRQATLAVLATCVSIAAVAAAAVPLVIDQPFATQTPATMTLVYELRRWGPAITAALAVVTILLVVAFARRARWWASALLIVPTAAVVAAFWVTRQNPFEWMFNRLPHAQYVPVAQAAFVEPRDIVLAVSADGESAAYPIRQIAYHHIVNDRIGRTPAVVTY